MAWLAMVTLGQWAAIVGGLIVAGCALIGVAVPMIEHSVSRIAAERDAQVLAVMDRRLGEIYQVLSDTNQRLARLEGLAGGEGLHVRGTPPAKGRRWDDAT